MELFKYLTDRYSEKLYAISKRSPLSHRHAALVLDKRLEILCSGYNKYERAQIKYKSDVQTSIHAEISALNKYLKIYKPRGRKAYMIFTGRANGSGITYGKPCEDCARKVKEAGLHIEWTRYR